jgi:DNA-binding NtrC family response regulator
MACRLMLERAGFEVAEAGNGKEGLRVFRQRPGDVVLCDLFMSDADGVELIRELCHDFPGVKVIAMSGGGFKGGLHLLSMARSLGAAEVLRKPFQQATLLATIRRVLEPASSGADAPAKSSA